MYYDVICNRIGRLRVRFGKYIFTKEQGYGLSTLLFSHNGVETVLTDELNGGVLITYNENISAEKLLAILQDVDFSTLYNNIATDEQKRKEIDDRFIRDLAYITSKRLLRKLIVPFPIRRVLTGCRSFKYVRLGLKTLLEGKLSVEVLDATAIGASYCYGQPQTASSIMFLLKVSDLLIDYSNARAKNALAGTLAINIETVWLVKDGVEVSVPLKSLQVNDVIRVRMGSMIPVDGNVLDGEAMVNEATMSGEPLAVHKIATSTVFAGTVIEEGSLDIEVRELSDNTRIAKIVDMIEEGEDFKASIQGKAERLADGIVPISFGLFASTLLLSGNMTRALSVLMVDFSCAIKITTPISIITALKEAAQHKILVKGGKYLEQLAAVDTIVFDKTGTLTNAVPKVAKVIAVHNDYDEDKVLKIAACIEEHFPHSVASAIVAEAKAKGLEHPEGHGKVEYIVAHGITTIYDGKRSIIGSRHFVFEDEKTLLPEISFEALDEMIGSNSAIYLAVGGELVGVICVNDPPKDDAKKSIQLLRKEGISKIIMITGDSEGTAKAISEELGLDGYFASVLPEGKAELVNALKAEGKKVLMVGDGINDTPALSCADVSMTLQGSSDLAKEVADIAILTEELEKIVYARRIATALMNKISKNYNIIVAFNTTLIALGMTGVITSAVAAWLHNSSTVAMAALSARPALANRRDDKNK